MRPSLSIAVAPKPVISLADAKLYLRVDHDDDDALISDLIASAVEAVDGPTGWLGRALGQQTLELRASHFPGCGFDPLCGFDPHWHVDARHRFHPHEMRLPCPPVQSIVSIGYVDPTGAAVTLDPTTYALFPERDCRYVLPAYGTPWPIARRQPGAVVVRYVAGYGIAPDGLGSLIPVDIKRALLLMIGAAYDTRADAAPITSLAEQILFGKQVFI